MGLQRYPITPTAIYNNRTMSLRFPPHLLIGIMGIMEARINSSNSLAMEENGVPPSHFR
jgi:hypothetical protein